MEVPPPISNEVTKHDIGSRKDAKYRTVRGNCDSNPKLKGPLNGEPSNLTEEITPRTILKVFRSCHAVMQGLSTEFTLLYWQAYFSSETLT